jgi:membrane-bound ClpP family serine protease
VFTFFKETFENLRQNNNKDLLVIILETYGGIIEVVVKYVNIIRYIYKNVYFINPNHALSAGTVFCLSGDKIFMDYCSSLSPIDPQIHNGKTLVPALGYLDQFEKLIQKSKNNT